MPTRTARIAVAAVLAGLVAAPAAAGPGDLLEVTADLVNLRAGPSDSANIRDRVEGGQRAIELRRDGGWYGVRMLDSGQEGWIYGELLRPVESSTLDAVGDTAGFSTLSEDFDLLVSQMDERLGVAMAEAVTEEGSRLVVRPTEAWLTRSSRDAQVFAAAAIYQMWKNYRNNAPVSVVLKDRDGTDYVVVEDQGEAGPRLTVIDEASGREG